MKSTKFRWQNVPVPLGTYRKHYGKISAVGITGGERYYWLIDEDGTVSMMPWFVIEEGELET